MRQIIEDLISMMEYHVEQTRPIHTTTVALQAAREALAKREQVETSCPECVFGVCHCKQEQGEPVANVVREGATVKLEWQSVDAAHNAKEGPLYKLPATDVEWLARRTQAAYEAGRLAGIKITLDEWAKSEPPQQRKPLTDAATVAGLHASIGHLSALVDHQYALLKEVNDVCGLDGHGGEPEDGESDLIDRIRHHLNAIVAPQQRKPLTDERKEAMKIYTPPFKHYRGYIHDAEGHMVSDDDQVKRTVAHRVRGWGRISYLPNAEAIQDEIGVMVADALNEYYAAHGIKEAP